MNDRLIIAAFIVCAVNSGLTVRRATSIGLRHSVQGALVLLSTVAAVGIAFFAAAAPLIRLRRAAMMVLTGSISLLFMLVGLRRLAAAVPGDSMLLSLLFVSISIAAFPFWWQAIFNGERYGQ